MEQILSDFIRSASTIEKAFFLMAAGLLFVFGVQLLFFLIVKLWPRSNVLPKTND